MSEAPANHVPRSNLLMLVTPMISLTLPLICRPPWAACIEQE
jgi:hypothetical protein